METFYIICSTPPNWFVYCSGFASLFALLFVILYFVKPKLNITPEMIDIANGIIKIECENISWFRLPIIDVKCDIVASVDNAFNQVITLPLYKDWTPGIFYNENYIFKCEDATIELTDKNYIKV